MKKMFLLFIGLIMVAGCFNNSNGVSEADILFYNNETKEENLVNFFSDLGLFSKIKESDIVYNETGTEAEWDEIEAKHDELFDGISGHYYIVNDFDIDSETNSLAVAKAWVLSATSKTPKTLVLYDLEEDDGEDKDKYSMLLLVSEAIGRVELVLNIEYEEKTSAGGTNSKSENGVPVEMNLPRIMVIDFEEDGEGTLQVGQSKNSKDKVGIYYNGGQLGDLYEVDGDITKIEVVGEIRYFSKDEAYKDVEIEAEFNGTKLVVQSIKIEG